MSKDVSFSLDIKGGEEILTNMMMPNIKTRAAAIAARAQSMAGSMSSDPPTFSVTTQIGTIKKGVRAFATIKAEGNNPHQSYVGNYVLARAKDAGR